MFEPLGNHGLNQPSNRKIYDHFKVKFGSSPHKSGLNINIFETTTNILHMSPENQWLYAAFPIEILEFLFRVAKKHRYLTENQRPTTKQQYLG